MEVINHFSHEEHPLILKELQEDDDLEKVDCYGCKQPVVSSGSTTYYYCCSECKVFLHKSCAELPLQITHPMHSEHPLQLLAKPAYLTGDCICSMCKRDWSGFTYMCISCEFDLDVFCAQLYLQGTLKHPGHPHPLKHQPRSALFECDACGIEDKDESYFCPECLFWLHKTCGSMTSITSVKYHDHPLSLANCLPEQYRHYYLSCDICNKKIHPSYWVYYCHLCRYFIHLKCMTSKSLKDEAAGPISYNDEEITPSLISLPAENLSELLIKHYREQNNILPQAELSTEIEQLGHEHPLIISNVQDDYYGFTEDDQESVCSACVEPISGSCYTCPECNYFIHLHCAYLPAELLSSVHPEHKLSLYNHLEISDCSLCSKCKCPCNGFMYKCEECDFIADIRCALLPATLKHEAHEHDLLVQDEISNEYCSACNYQHEDHFFSCKTCPYKLSMHCATLPKIVGHRWDKHPLILSFPPYYYHVDQFTCDMCGEEIHPKYWLYHCRECDNSFHEQCIPRISRYPRMKFGGKLEIDYHPHPLTFMRTVHYDKFSCDKCGKNLEGGVAFQCEPCYFNMCHPCVFEIVMSMRELFNLKEE